MHRESWRDQRFEWQEKSELPGIRQGCAGITTVDRSVGNRSFAQTVRNGSEDRQAFSDSRFEAPAALRFAGGFCGSHRSASMSDIICAGNVAEVPAPNNESSQPAEMA